MNIKSWSNIALGIVVVIFVAIIGFVLFATVGGLSVVTSNPNATAAVNSGYTNLSLFLSLLGVGILIWIFSPLIKNLLGLGGKK